MITRRYVFRVLVQFPDKPWETVSGMSFHRSWLPQPEAAWNNMMNHVLTESKVIDPRLLIVQAI